MVRRRLLEAVGAKLGLAVLLGGAACWGQVLATVCNTSPWRSWCNEFFVEHGMVKSRDVERGTVKVVGPYLRGFQALVPADEAPTELVRSPAGWQVIVTWTFKSAPFLLHRLYFFSPVGELKLKFDGFERYEELRAGRLFASDTEFFLATGGGPSSSSVAVRIWILPPKGEPKAVLEEGGAYLDSIQRGGQASAPGIWMTRLSIERPARREKREFWEWMEAEQKFRKKFEEPVTDPYAPQEPAAAPPLSR